MTEPESQHFRDCAHNRTAVRLWISIDHRHLVRQCLECGWLCPEPARVPADPPAPVDIPAYGRYCRDRRAFGTRRKARKARANGTLVKQVWFEAAIACELVDAVQ